MKTQDQVINMAQAMRLQELGVRQDSLFIWRYFETSQMLEVACNGTVIYQHGVSDTTNQSFGEIYAAFTAQELTAILKGDSPYWVNIWDEWGYKDAKGIARGYMNFTNACAERLIDLLENNAITVDRVNAALTPETV